MRPLPKRRTYLYSSTHLPLFSPQPRSDRTTNPTHQLSSPLWQLEQWDIDLQCLTLYRNPFPLPNRLTSGPIPLRMAVDLINLSKCLYQIPNIELQHPPYQAYQVYLHEDINVQVRHLAVGQEVGSTAQEVVVF